MEENLKKPHCCPHEGCNSSFDRPYRLAQHVLVHNNVKAFACTEENCAKSYTNKSHLNRHIESVHKDPDNDLLYSCPTCLKKYSNRQNLKRHIKITHLLKVPFSCETCKMEFKKKNQLSAHMYIHTGIKSFSCELCSEEFVRLYDKKRHMRIHKIHSCTECPLKFQQWSKYQKHRKSVHLGATEYICDECGRAFKSKNYIRRHIKTHNLTKQFPCPYEKCKRFYSRNSNLKQHILMKHEELTYDCDICEAQLSTKAKLNEHLSKMHRGTKLERRMPRTKATGRKPRKDKGVMKVSSAVKLSGLAITHPLVPQEKCVTDSRKFIEVHVA